MDKTYVCKDGCRLSRKELTVIPHQPMRCPVHGNRVNIEFVCPDCGKTVVVGARQGLSKRCKPCQLESIRQYDSRRKRKGPAKKKSLISAAENMFLQDVGISAEKVAAAIGCSKRTADRAKRRAMQNAKWKAKYEKHKAKNRRVEHAKSGPKVRKQEAKTAKYHDCQGYYECMTKAALLDKDVNCYRCERYEYKSLSALDILGGCAGWQHLPDMGGQKYSTRKR